MNNGKYRKISLLLCLMLVLGVLAAGCGDKGTGGDGGDQDQVSSEDTSLTDVEAKGTLVVGCDDGFPPMGFVGDNDEITGFDIELAQAVAEKLGVEAKVKAIDWPSKEMSLNSGKIDVIWNGYTINKERNGQVEFTKPYLNNKQVIVVLKDSASMTKADLAGKVVAAQEDSSGLDAIQGDEEFANSVSGVNTYAQYLPALMDLQNGRVEAVVIDNVVIDYVMNQTPGVYRVLDEDMGSEYYGIGCRKDGVALREAIDTALDEMAEDGTLDQLSSKWFGSNIVIRDVPKLTDEEL